MRALAETENVRQRMTKQVSDVRLFGIQGFCKDLLEVADILQQATQSVPEKELQENKHLRDLYDGLVMTEAQLQKVFIKHGLEQIIPQKGDKFDPHFHEALFQVPAEDPSMASNVATVEKLGYKLHERTLRPALVGVFKSWWAIGPDSLWRHLVYSYINIQTMFPILNVQVEKWKRIQKTSLTLLEYIMNVSIELVSRLLSFEWIIDLRIDSTDVWINYKIDKIGLLRYISVLKDIFDFLMLWIVLFMYLGVTAWK